MQPFARRLEFLWKLRNKNDLGMNEKDLEEHGKLEKTIKSPQLSKGKKGKFIRKSVLFL